MFRLLHLSYEAVRLGHQHLVAYWYSLKVGKHHLLLSFLGPNNNRKSSFYDTRFKHETKSLKCSMLSRVTWLVIKSQSLNFTDFHEPFLFRPWRSSHHPIASFTLNSTVLFALEKQIHSICSRMHPHLSFWKPCFVCPNLKNSLRRKEIIRTDYSQHSHNL